MGWNSSYYNTGKFFILSTNKFHAFYIQGHYYDSLLAFDLICVFMKVYPGAWTAILVSLDNVGVWNLRTENLDAWYLGQETYVRVVNPEKTNKTELPIPDNALFCGSLSKLQKYVPIKTIQFSEF